MTGPVHVVGASGRSGAALCRALLAEGIKFIPVVRDAGRWQATGLPGAPRVADLTDSRALTVGLCDAVRVASCAHARHIPAILAATQATRLVFLGSTRRFTRWPDAHGQGVQAGEAAFVASRRPGAVLHPTMIYGARGEDNVQRLARLLRQLPLIPLPGGGQALVQPIYQDDVTRCLLSALHIEWDGPRAMVIAGPTPVRYVDFVRAVARAARLRPPRIVRVPTAPMLALAPLTRLLPGMPRVRASEIRRLLEHKAFDIAPMREVLGVDPLPLDHGLALTFQGTPCPS